MHRLMALPLTTLTCHGWRVADPREPHKAPNHISKTVPPTIHLGPPNLIKSRTFLLTVGLDLQALSAPEVCNGRHIPPSSNGTRPAVRKASDVGGSTPAGGQSTAQRGSIGRAAEGGSRLTVFTSPTK